MVMVKNNIGLLLSVALFSSITHEHSNIMNREHSYPLTDTTTTGAIEVEPITVLQPNNPIALPMIISSRMSTPSTSTAVIITETPTSEPTKKLTTFDWLTTDLQHTTARTTVAPTIGNPTATSPTTSTTVSPTTTSPTPTTSTTVSPTTTSPTPTTSTTVSPAATPPTPTTSTTVFTSSPVHDDHNVGHAVASDIKPVTAYKPVRIQETCIWSEWGPCSTSCDYGIHERRLVSTSNMQRECRTRRDTERAVCFVRPCPVDCTYDETWLPWTPCSVPCGGGYRYRVRLVTQEAIFGGAPCNSSDLAMKSDCNNESCAYECRITGQWGSWSSCTDEDGVYLQTREIPFDAAVKANRSGPNTTCDETTQYRLCDAHNATVVKLPKSLSYECMQTDWSAWSPCSASCGTGTQYRTRKILIPAVGSAPPCGPTYDSQPCNTISCLESNIASICSRRRNTYIPLGRCSAEYIYCTPGAVAVFNTCPQGQAFRADVGLCAKMDSISECSVLARIENSCQGRANGMYPLCTCCPQYLVCWESMAVTRTCGAGQVFNSVPYGHCVDRSQADNCP